MTLEPSIVDTAKIIDEWAGAHAMLNHADVPSSPPDAPHIVWSLPSRIRWLIEQPEHTNTLARDLGEILKRYDRNRSQVR